MQPPFECAECSVIAAVSELMLHADLAGSVPLHAITVAQPYPELHQHVARSVQSQ